jgi:YidC/Oxa1 family membrane protein insertase
MLAFAPLDRAVGTAYALFSQLSAAVSPIGGAAVAIVVFTLAVRLLLAPLSYTVIRGQRAQAALAPRLQQLRQRHRDDPARLVTETRALYRREGISPVRGVLPALLQAPFFTVAYQLFTSANVAHQPNALLHQSLFGVPLGTSWLGVLGGGVFSAPSLVFGVLLGMLALLAWWSGRRAQRLAGTASPVLRLLPFGTVLFAAAVPLAAGIYLLTSTAYSALESLVLRREPVSPAGANRQQRGG